MDNAQPIDESDHALLNRRLTLAERRNNLAMDVTLVSSYNIARGLTELLNSINSGAGRFSDDERNKINLAHRHTALALMALTEIVIDHGNQTNPENGPVRLLEGRRERDTRTGSRSD